MKRLLVGFLSLLLVTEVFAGYGGFRGGGFRSFGGGFKSSSFKSSSYKGSSGSYRTTPRYQSTSSGGSILPTLILLSIVNSNSHASSSEKAKVAKENGIQDLQFLKKAKSQEECNKLSQDEKYIVSYRKDKGWCYGFNRSE